MVNQEKAQFLRHSLTSIIRNIPPLTPPIWGKMSVQQMVEHMSDYVRIASGKTQLSIVTEAERIPKMQNFLRSEKQFPENTPNVLLPDTPPPVKHAIIDAAIDELQEEIDYFFVQFEGETHLAFDNPFFGTLDFEHQVLLLHKHSLHHLRQFGYQAPEPMSDKP